MKFKTMRKTAAKPAALLGGALVAGAMLIPAEAALAQSDPNTDDRIAAGYAASPVPLNLTGKNQAQVGVGSYIINTIGVCNHCHSNTQYVPAGDPYDLNPPYTGKIVNGRAQFTIDQTTFVAGGASFGAVYSKNLTPAPSASVTNPTSKTPYYAAGGNDWPTFWGILHNGTDIDKILLPTTGVQPGPITATTANDTLLQVMPWPAVRHLTDSDLNAVWQYLSAIPCTSNHPKSSTNTLSQATLDSYGSPNTPGVLENTCSPTPVGQYKFYTWQYGQAVPVQQWGR